MLKVNYIALNEENEYVEGKIILPDNFEYPIVKHVNVYLGDLIKYLKNYNTVSVIYSKNIDADNIDIPNEKEILIAKSKIEHQEGLEKYGLITDCPLCGRHLAKKEVSKHHLIPVSKGSPKGKKVYIHRVCHVKIHSLFTEEELALKYNTIEMLKEHEEIQKFIKWLKNKPDNFYTVSRRKKSRSDKKYKSDLII